MFKSLSNTQLMVMFLGSKKLLKTHSKSNLPRLMATLSAELLDRNFIAFKGWYDFSRWENYHQFTMKPYQNHALTTSFSQN
ncbi:hypothetical protein K8S19_13000 [bacterium]|nr:hypothetical protein [bacterium]